MKDAETPASADMLRIGRQLRCPAGEHGREVARKMALSNQSMIDATFATLRVDRPGCLLELGHGDGVHIGAWMAQHPELSCVGLEISPDMRDAAAAANAAWVEQGRARFQLYDGGEWPTGAPFSPPGVDYVVTVNTVYFWADPLAVLRRLRGIMRGSGVLALGFAHREFMANLPFTREGFTFYEVEQLRQLVAAAGWAEVEVESFSEHIPGARPGETQLRKFSVIRAVAR